MSRAEGSGVAALLNDYREYAGPRLWAALALMLLGAIAEGFGLLMIVPLASIAMGDNAGTLGRFNFSFGPIPVRDRLIVALGLFVAFMTARSILLYARELALTRLQSGYEASLRLRAASTLAQRGWPFASRMGQAEMQALLLTDVSRASQAVNSAQLFAVAAIMLIVQFVLTLLLAPALALIALAIVLLGSVAAARWTRRGVASGIALVERSEQSASSGFRLHAGLKSAIAQGSVPQFLEEYSATLSRATKEWVRYSRDLNSSRQLAALAAALAAALLLFAGLRIFELPFPVLIASLALFARMVAPAQSLQQSAQHLAAYAQSFSAIRRRLGTLRPPASEESPAVRLPWKELRLDRVAFQHQPGLGLRKTSLVVRSGEWIGLSGASGAGKTTLVDLVAGLFEPAEGEIVIDGRSLDGGLIRQWRAGLAYVGQDGIVFNDTVRGNLGAGGTSPASDEDLWQVLERVGLLGRVRAFPNGLDQEVGDRGSQLSGGERQRLVIARGLLRRPSLLMLDEATAALDADGEAELLKELRALAPRPAALVIAHRESTLIHCDSVIRIQDKS